MSTANPEPADIARLRAAGEWVQQLSETDDQELIDRWIAWCAADPRNLQAFATMQEVWDGFAGADPVMSSAARPVSHVSRTWGWMSAAAGVLLLVGIGAWFATRYATVQDFHAPPGEQRSEVLVDGSRLDLAPDSEVRVRFAPFRREVQLRRGQAFFAVSHNLFRSFIVRADNLTVTAVGTAFDVRIGPNGAVVTVSEGTVHVTPTTSLSAGSPQAVLAGIGQRVTLSAGSQGLSTAAVDPVAAESWRRGVLPFVGEPLENVVGEINRYSSRKIDIAPGFSQTRFTGTVSLGHVEDWLNALPQIFSVEIIDRGSHEIQIRSRATHDIS